MPTAVRGRLVARVAEIHETLDRRGLIDPIIKTGSIGPDARWAALHCRWSPTLRMTGKCYSRRRPNGFVSPNLPY
jgi:hypothetical protein